MGEVGQETLSCSDFAADFQGLVQREVGDVRSPAYAAYDEDVHSVEKLYGLGTYVIGVCQVSQPAEPEAQDRESVVHGPYRDNLRSVDAEGGLAYGVQYEVRYSGITVVPEGVGVLAFERFLDYGLGVDRKCLVHEIVECSDIVQASGVVLVHVGQQHGIQFLDAAAQDLLAEIRTGIHDQPQAVIFDVGRGSESFVMEIIRAADRAGAADDGHALGGACAEKFYFVADFSAHRPQR